MVATDQGEDNGSLQFYREPTAAKPEQHTAGPVRRRQNLLKTH